MSQFTPNERNCKIHFQQNVRRNNEDRFIVKLPLIHEKFQQLGAILEKSQKIDLLTWKGI